MLVGGIFGGLLGTVQAIKYKQFIIIPITIIVSGVCFGGLISIGSIVRTE